MWEADIRDIILSSSLAQGFNDNNNGNNREGESNGRWIELQYWKNK